MRKTLISAVADLAVVAIFVLIGTLSHEKALTATSYLTVAWPFVAGLLLGWFAVQAWRRPTTLWPTGVFIFAITIAGAMTLRSLTGSGTELSFIVVTTGVLAVGLLGWRALAQSFAARRAPHSAEDLAIIAAVKGTAPAAKKPEPESDSDNTPDAKNDSK